MTTIFEQIKSYIEGEGERAASGKGTMPTKDGSAEVKWTARKIGGNRVIEIDTFDDGQCAVYMIYDPAAKKIDLVSLYDSDIFAPGGDQAERPRISAQELARGIKAWGIRQVEINNAAALFVKTMFDIEENTIELQTTLVEESEAGGAGAASAASAAAAAGAAGEAPRTPPPAGLDWELRHVEDIKRALQQERELQDVQTEVESGGAAAVEGEIEIRKGMLYNLYDVDKLKYTRSATAQNASLKLYAFYVLREAVRDLGSQRVTLSIYAKAFRRAGFTRNVDGMSLGKATHATPQSALVTTHPGVSTETYISQFYDQVASDKTAYENLLRCFQENQTIETKEVMKAFYHCLNLQNQLFQVIMQQEYTAVEIYDRSELHLKF